MRIGQHSATLPS